MALTYHVPDMHCQHCVDAVTAAIRKDMPQAHVKIDLGNHLVVVSEASSPERVAAAIAQAGYAGRQL